MLVALSGSSPVSRLSKAAATTGSAGVPFGFLSSSPSLLSYLLLLQNFGLSSWATPPILFTLATTLPAIQAPHPRFPPHCFQPALTPPYHHDEPTPDRSWSTHSEQRGSDGIFPMSGYPPRPSHSAHTTPQPSPIQSYLGMQPPQWGSPRDGPTNHPILPPLRQLSSTPPTPSTRRHGDPFQSILNPQAELLDHQRDRRRSASHMESPSPIETPTSQSLPSISRPTSVDSTQDEQQLPRSFQPPGRPSARHISNPKSPRIHRTPSFNLLNPPTGTIDAHRSPFLTASTRPSESMLSQQSLPTPPAGMRPSYFPPMPRTESRRPSITFPQSGSASPVGPYSPYSQPASVASSQQRNMHMHEPRLSVGPMEGDRSMISMAPSGQSSIQLMTIKSQQGHNVQIPVDVQAASKVADEKRRRNAGASARFRARRKEKEREASMSISRLEQQLQRDHFRSICLQQTTLERSHVRPTSPRLRRPSLPPSQAPSSTRGGSEDSYDYDEEIREDERNVRRRTSNYHPVPGPPPNELHSPSLGPQGFGSSFPHMDTTSSQATPSGQQFLHHDDVRPSIQERQGSENPVYHDPFTSESRRYVGQG
ncbi:hypothetical protein DE146DRAFT_676796 [Phaeosphaeria sp. MPI-PUGE-AT-0046c]|nr:hypothetical protein DE146DRAFT_676796 [Phaeosphaeria sp. MPI-PUGE-AT-0046c]